MKAVLPVALLKLFNYILHWATPEKHGFSRSLFSLLGSLLQITVGDAIAPDLPSTVASALA